MSEQVFFAAAAALFGTMLGSFINALSFRFNTGRGMGGRSRCMHCGHALGAFDLIPVLSWVFLRGRCRYCSARISLQYPLVEAAAGAVALLLFFKHPEPLSFGFWLLVWMTLLFEVVYDLRHKILPWSATMFLLALAVLSLIVSFEPTLRFAADTSRIWAGPALAAPFLALFLVSRGRWMGFGDIPLMLSIGWLLGFWHGLSALMLGVWAGALVGISLTLLKKGTTMKSEVPFAPFLAFGAFAAYFLNVDIFSSLASLWH